MELKTFVKSKWRSALAIVGAVVMYFAPDSVDKVVEVLLLALGCDVFILEKKNK